MEENIELLKYPIGKYAAPEAVDAGLFKKWIAEFEGFPSKLKAAVTGLNEAALNSTYRPGSWTVRQVVHHLADSHLNAYVRFKLILTEDNPTVKPYFEDRWAEIEDAKHGAVESSLNILEGLHNRLAQCLKSIKVEDLDRTYFHPEHQRQFDLKYMLGMYVWHGEHHLAQIRNAVKKRADSV